MNSNKFSKFNSCLTGPDQHRYCLQIKLNNCTFRSQSKYKKQRNPLLPRALSISTTSNNSRGAVLVLPGFLYGSKPYLGLVNSLQQRGYTAAVVPVSPRDWWSILIGGDFQWYLRKMDSALSELYNKHGSVALVGHSAGGWVARILLGEVVAYQGQTFPGRRKKVHSLVTLGTPHASVEAYPLGRVAEKLVIDPESIMKFKTGATGAVVEAAEINLPEGVQGSSLQFANYFYPDASYLPGVQVVCAVGDAITGETPIWRDGKNKNETISSKTASLKNNKNTSKYDAGMAYEGYKSGCGDGTVPGDGVTPICIAHLPGAENIVLPGVWHGPKSKLPERPWYGDDVVLNTWVESTKGPINFHDYINCKWTLLFSHPSDFTPVCTSEIGQAAKLQDEFKKRDVQVVGLACNDIESHKQWIQDIEGSLSEGRKIEFPIVADPDRAIVSKYGMFDAEEADETGRGYAARAVFIIGPDKKLKLSMLYPASTGRSFHEILRAIDSLKIASKLPVATPAEWAPGEEVMILPKVSEEEAKDKFPDHRVIQVKSGKAYVRKTKLPEE